jgi:hypothetical protein
MDEIVKQAIHKWPKVPACYGWLALDCRGDWYLRDESAQNKGPFSLSKGSKLVHSKLIEFINRNYQPDEAGRYFFQNGPQKVFVELELAPYILRFNRDQSIYTHTGVGVKAEECYVDEQGRVYLKTDLGLGLIHSLDMDLLADQIINKKFMPQPIQQSLLEDQFGYVKSPINNLKK